MIFYIYFKIYGEKRKHNSYLFSITINNDALQVQPRAVVHVDVRNCEITYVWGMQRRPACMCMVLPRQVIMYGKREKASSIHGVVQGRRNSRYV